jgi:uncharacterized protein (TIGR03067 family)
MPTAPHLSEAELKALVLGQTDEAGSHSLEEHLQGCSECQRLAAEVPGDTLVELLRSAQTRVVTESVTPPAIMQAETLAAGPVSHSPAALPAALIRHARYRLLRPLGAGGMGSVWLAEHKVMNRQVALKVIRPEFLEKPGAIGRFRREVQAAARLHHPNIVTAHDAEQAGDVHFLVMEYVDGTDLQNVLEERGPLPVTEACEYVRQAALGLQHAHEHGMVHRDIKPQNLMVSGQERDLVRILDFGLASLVASAVVEESTPTSAESQKSTLTQVGSLMGTPDYMAPEQARDARTADIRSDVYSLGCTFYCLLTGKVPFPGGTAIDKVIAHSQRRPQPLAELRKDVPLALVKVIDKMTAKDPAQRYQTPAEVAAALEPFTIAKLAKPRRRVKGIVAVAALAAAVLLGAATIYVQTDQGEFVIETSDKDVAVMVETRGVKIRDQVSGREYLLRAGTQDVRTGNYNIVLSELPEGIEMEGKVFTVKRGGRAVATAKLREKDDRARLQGEWAIVMAEDAGGKHDFAATHSDADLLRFTFTGNRMRISNCDFLNDEGEFRLHESAQPKQFTWNSTSMRLSWYGIYRFNGDALELYMDEFEKDRPTDFSSKGFSKKRCLWVLKRPSGSTPKPATDTRDAVAAKPRQLHVIDNGSQVRALKYAPDGKTLIVAGEAMATFDPTSGKRVWQEKLDQERLASFVTTPLALSRDGRTVACGAGEWVYVFDLVKHQRITKIHASFQMAVALSPDGRTLVYAPDRSLRFHDLITGKSEIVPDSDGYFGSLCFSPDGRFLLGTGDKGKDVLLVLDAKTRRVADKKYIGHPGLVAFSGDGKRVVVANKRQETPVFQVFGLSDGDLMLQYRETALPTGAGSVSLSADGRYLALGLLNGVVQIWDLTQKRLATSWIPHGSGAFFYTAVAFAPDGKFLATGGRDQIKIWDLTDKVIKTDEEPRK